MGTTMAFYHIRNDGLDRERLQGIMGRSFGGRKGGKSEIDRLAKVLAEHMGEDMAEQFRGWMELAQQEIKKDQERYGGMMFSRPELPSPMVAYRPDAAWLPFFEVDTCEGYNASSRDARKLSKLFGAPVLAFSIFDSDILMVSYSDAAEKVEYNFAKPNIEGMEEYDTQLFQNELPAFLLDLCPALTKEKLTEIWEADEVFADDRMYKLGEVLGLSPINGEVPEGFEVITAD